MCLHVLKYINIPQQLTHREYEIINVSFGNRKQSFSKIFFSNSSKGVWIGWHEGGRGLSTRTTGRSTLAHTSSVVCKALKSTITELL